MRLKAPTINGYRIKVLSHPRPAGREDVAVSIYLTPTDPFDTPPYTTGHMGVVLKDEEAAEAFVDGMRDFFNTLAGEADIPESPPEGGEIDGHKFAGIKGCVATNFRHGDKED